MAESARRSEDGVSGDALRRLIARPIRVHAARAAEPVRMDVVQPVLDPAPLSAAPRDVPADTTSAHPAPADLGRLKAEMLVMKAVLAAERRETKTLRATIGLDEADETLGEEARAVRDRWAALVDRILHTTA